MNRIARQRYTQRDNERVRSGFEKQVLDALSESGVDYEYEAETLSYVKEHKYTPDITLPNGILIEVKGFFEPADRTKALLVRAQNLDKDIRFVFQRASTKLSKKSKTSYADWCDKHGFLWAEKRVPKEWIDETS